MKVGEIKEVIDGVYSQKLTMLLDKLQSWEKKKCEVFSEMYISSIQGKLQRLERNEKEVKNQLLQFIKVLNMQYQFLSKLRREDKAVEISSVFKCLQTFAAEFTAIKDSLLELSDFLGKFMGVTNYEYVEIKKIYDEVGEIKERYAHQKGRFLQSYTQKKQSIYSKKNSKKHFELKNILELLAEVEKERKIHEQAFMRLHNAEGKQLEFKHKMYKNIHDNLQFVAKLYQSGFRKEILQEVTQHFSKKLADSINDLAHFQQQDTQDLRCEQLLKSLREDFYKYFDSFVEQITVGNWSVGFHKKNEVSEKVANENETTQMFLTFDKKIFFYRLLKREIEFERTIDDVKIYAPFEEGKFEMKDKKSKEKFVVIFERSQKQDEFFLHTNQMLKHK